jgi:tetratricopeptide (TPR) repeat protein
MEDRAMKRSPAVAVGMAGLLVLAALIAIPAPGARAQAGDTAVSPEDQARRLADQERYAEALAVLNSALAQDSTDTGLLWLRAGVTGWSGRHADAVRLYEALVAAHPEMADAVRLDLAGERLWAGDDDGALRDADAHLAGHPGDPQARRLRALALSYANRLDEAEAAYRGLLAEDPNDAEAREGYARTLNWQGRHRQAAAAYRDLMRDGATDPDVLQGLAQAEYWAGRPDLARAALARLPESRRRDPELAALAYRLDGQRRPSLTLGYEQSLDSDDLELRTGTAAYRHPLGDRDVLSYLGRADCVQDDGGHYDPRRLGLGYERIWSYTWETHAFAHVQFRGSQPDLLLFDTWATCRPVETLRFDFGVAREQVITRQALDRSVVVVSASASAEWRFAPRWAAAGEHRENFYTYENRTWLTSANLLYRLVTDRELTVDVGPEAAHLASKENRDDGYYDPNAYLEAGGRVEVTWEPGPGWLLRLETRAGWQQEKGSPSDAYYGVDGRLEIPIAHRFSLALEGSDSDSNLASESGFQRTAWGIFLTTWF